MVKQQCHRTQGSKHQAVKRRVKENSEVFSKFSVVFFLFMEKRNKGIPLCQGKSSLTPLQQLSCPLTSTWLARSSRLLSPAVKCPLVWHQALRSQPEFSQFENLPTPPTCSALWLGLWASRDGTGGWHVCEHRSELPWLGCQAVGQAGEIVAPHLPLLPPCHTRILGAELLLLCSLCLTKWFLPPTAPWSFICFLLRQRNQSEEHWCHKYLGKGSHPV